MVGKRLNKMITQCQLNWRVIDCVEEFSVNFLTNTVQEENINILIDEINKEYRPKFLQKNNIEIFKRAKDRLNEIKKLNIDEIDSKTKILRGTGVLQEIIQQFENLVNNYEFDIEENERKIDSHIL